VPEFCAVGRCFQLVGKGALNIGHLLYKEPPNIKSNSTVDPVRKVFVRASASKCGLGRDPPEPGDEKFCLGVFRSTFEDCVVPKIDRVIGEVNNLAHEIARRYLVGTHSRNKYASQATADSLERFQGLYSEPFVGGIRRASVREVYQGKMDSLRKK